MSVANLLCDGSTQRRFHAEPMVAATERLLHEKVPRTSQFEASGAAEDLGAETEGGKETAKAGQENWGVAPKLNTAA